MACRSGFSMQLLNLVNIRGLVARQGRSSQKKITFRDILFQSFWYAKWSMNGRLFRIELRVKLFVSRLCNLALSRLSRGLWTLSKIESSARVARHPRFILLVSFSVPCGVDFKHSLKLPLATVLSVLKRLKRKVQEKFLLFS